LATVAKQVTIVCEGDKLMDTLLAKKMSKAGNVTILKGAQVLEVKGDTYARTLVVKDKTGKVAEYSADGMFVEKALTANAKMVEGLVPLDERGRIVVDCACRTNVPGLFAAGDVTNTYAEQVLIAIGEGAKAALSAYDYLLPALA
jgi:alkyl hydroperoxide reductase subunit F